MKYIYRKSFEAIKERIDSCYKSMWYATIGIIIFVGLGAIAVCTGEYSLATLFGTGLILCTIFLVDSSTEWMHQKERIIKEYPKRAEEILEIK